MATDGAVIYWIDLIPGNIDCWSFDASISKMENGQQVSLQAVAKAEVMSFTQLSEQMERVLQVFEDFDFSVAL